MRLANLITNASRRSKCNPSAECTTTAFAVTVLPLQATVFSSSCNGEVCAWNLSAKNCTAKIKAHDGFVRGPLLSPFLLLSLLLLHTSFVVFLLLRFKLSVFVWWACCWSNYTGKNASSRRKNGTNLRGGHVYGLCLGHLLCTLGLAISPLDAFLVSGGDDKRIKQWRIPPRSSLSDLDVQAAGALQCDEGLLAQLQDTDTVHKRGLDPQVREF